MIHGLDFQDSSFSYFQNGQLNRFEYFEACQIHAIMYSEDYTSSSNTISYTFRAANVTYPVNYTKKFTFQNGNVIKSEIVGGSTIEYEYDNKINPFSNVYIHAESDIPFAQLFSANNVTKIKIKNNTGVTMVNNIHYTYNNYDLPVTATLDDGPDCRALYYGTTPQQRFVTFQYSCP